MLALPAQVFVCFFNDLVGRRLTWSLAHWTNENEKLLAQRENLLVLDDRTTHFLIPEIRFFRLVYTSQAIFFVGGLGRGRGRGGGQIRQSSILWTQKYTWNFVVDRLKPEILLSKKCQRHQISLPPKNMH